MRTIARQILRFSAIQFLFFSFISYGTPLSFDSRSSTIRVKPGSTLDIQNPISNFTGTLKRDDGATITGADITFVEGTFEDLGNEIKMSAVLEPTTTIVLGGDDIIRVAPSKVLQGVTVSSFNNKIEGAPLFTAPITLTDSSSTVSLALQSDLSQNVVMNGGTVLLENDLSFVDEKMLTGVGTVFGNGYRFKTGCKDFTWSDNRTWKDCSNIEIRADKVNLDSTFTFEGVTTINGHGNVLDLVNEGTIAIADNATLHISDLNLKGLGAGAGNITFGTNAQLILSNVNIELSGDMTTSSGSIYVKSPGIWIIRSYNWTFNGTSLVTVDGATVIKDRGDATTTDNDVIFGDVETNFHSERNGRLEFFCCRELRSRVEELESCCEEIQECDPCSRIEVLESCCAALQTSTGELISIIDSLEFEDVCDACSRIEVLESCCAELKTSTGELISIIDAIEDCDVCSRVEVLESCCAELKTSTGELISIIDAIEDCDVCSRVEVLESCCAELKTSTGELISIIDTIDPCDACSRVEVLESVVTELQTSTGELISIIDAIEDCDVCSRVEVLESCCAELKTSTGELISIIDAIEDCDACSRIEVIEGDITNLDIRIFNLEKCDPCSRIEVLESCCAELKTSTGELISIIDAIELCDQCSRIEVLESCCEEVGSRIEVLESIVEECCVDCIISITAPDTLFDPNTMLPGPEEAVVLRFEPCWGYVCGGQDDLEIVGNMPSLIFPDSTKVELPTGSRMIFQGEGVVDLRDGVEFTSVDGTTGDPTLLPACAYPHIIIEERAMMIPAANAEVLFSGWLNFDVRDAGKLLLNQEDSHVVFGSDSLIGALFPGGPTIFDLTTAQQINVLADAVGSVIVDEIDSRISFQRGIFNVDFSRNSLLSILNGTVEFNSNDGVYQPGNLSTFIFSEGSNLEVQRGVEGATGGLLRFSPNLDNSLTYWDNRTGVIDGGGHKDFGKGNMQFIADDVTGASGVGQTLTGVVDTTLRLQDNYFQKERELVELFLEAGLILKSGEALGSPSDLNVLVRLGDDAGTLAAINPLPVTDPDVSGAARYRSGVVIELEPGDHDVAYCTINADGFGQFPIIGIDKFGRPFEIDENGVRS